MSEEVYLRLKESSRLGLALSVDFRLTQLRCLRKLLTDEDEVLIESVLVDFKKTMWELKLEVAYVLSKIDYAISNLKNWVKPETVPGGSLHMMDTVETQHEPFGLVLIISPWNYPIILLLEPLIGAIAAGNCVILKPSEFVPTFSETIKEVLPKYLSKDCYCVVTGDKEVAQSLLEREFDLIFFTGSTSIGKIVMTAAAQHLTPVVLELGGKCPCYVDKSCNIVMAAKRIAWSSMINCGQVCVSIDYVLCHHSVREVLEEKITEFLKKFFGEDPKTSPDYGRIINLRNLKRLISLITNTKGRILCGADFDEDELFLSPTIVTDVQPGDVLMKEEIFGPILPILSVEDHVEAIRIIKERSKPLDIYAFNYDSKVTMDLRTLTSSGGLVLNDPYMQMSITELPFGGVGYSGMGSYHGKKSYECFSHRKSFYCKNYYFKAVDDVMLPPMTPNKFWIIRKFL